MPSIGGAVLLLILAAAFYIVGIVAGTVGVAAGLLLLFVQL
jgi:hypothetical protein